MRNLVFAAFVAASLSACAQTASTDQSSAAPSTTTGPADGAGSTDASATVDPNSPDYVSAPGRPARCFMTNQVRNSRADGVSRVLLRTNRQDVFEVTLFAGCRNLGTGMTLQVSPQIQWMRNACVGDRVIVFQRTSANRSCSGRVARSLTPEQVEALPSRLRP